MSEGTAVAVASTKGGVGKTTTSINLGAVIASTGRSIVVVEADLAMANVVDFLRLDVDPDVDPSLHDVLAGDAAVADAIYPAPGGFDVVPSGADDGGYAATGSGALSGVVATLRGAYDLVVLDTAPGVSQGNLAPLELADAVALVSTPRVAAVRDTKKTKELAERLGGTVVGVVFTMSGTGTAPPADYLADFLSVELLGHVPEDEAVPDSQDAGVPVVNYAPDSPAAKGYRAAAGRLLELLGGG